MKRARRAARPVAEDGSLEAHADPTYRLYRYVRDPIRQEVHFFCKHSWQYCGSLTDSDLCRLKIDPDMFGEKVTLDAHWVRLLEP